MGREITVNEIQKIEDEISAKCANKNAETVKQYVKQLDSTSGNFSQLGMWKLKNKLCPKQNDPPMAKKDKMGALITEPNLLKKLYLDTYSDRLRSREIRPELKDLYDLKCKLWELRFDTLKNTKSRKWTMQDLDKVLKKLKTNKTRDPHGLINEIFKPGVVGCDLKEAILDLFNGVKSDFFSPKVSSICKYYHNLQKERVPPGFKQ